MAVPLILTVMKPPFRFNQVDKTPTKVTGPDGIPSRLSRNPYVKEINKHLRLYH